MKRSWLLAIILVSAPALADVVESLNWNASTRAFTAVTHANGTKQIQAVGGAAPDSILTLLSSVTTAYTVKNDDKAGVIQVSTGSTTVNVTLPSAASNKGRILTIYKTDAGSGKITVTRAGSDTINGYTSTDIGTGAVNQYDYLTLVSNGASQWNVIGSGGEVFSAASGSDSPAQASPVGGTFYDVSGLTLTPPAGDYIFTWQCVAGAVVTGTAGQAAFVVVALRSGAATTEDFAAGAQVQLATGNLSGASALQATGGTTFITTAGATTYKLSVSINNSSGPPTYNNVSCRGNQTNSYIRARKIK